MPNDPEKELQEFLAGKPQWIQTALQQGASPLTRQELFQWFDHAELIDELTDQYEQILCRIPDKWKEYRERSKREHGTMFARILLPKERPGRPRNDALKIEAEQLKNAGLSWAQIERHLNQKHGQAVVTREGVRKLVSRGRKSTAPAPAPDKTQR